MKNEKILKITIEYETHLKYLKGEEAQEWMDKIDNMCVLAQARGQNPFTTYIPDWKYEGNLE